MNGNGNGHKRRAVDQSAVVAASRTLWDWFERHHIDALAVIVVSLYLTVDTMRWAMDFADLHYSEQGMHIPAIIAAVLTPLGIMQSALFKFYADLKNRDFPPAAQTLVMSPPAPAAPSTVVVTPGVVQEQKP